MSDTMSSGVLEQLDAETRLMQKSRGGNKADRIKIPKGHTWRLRFVPHKFPNGLHWARIAFHWINKRPILCLANTETKLGGIQDFDCPICRIAAKLNDISDKEVSKAGYYAQANTQWLVFALVFGMDGGDGEESTKGDLRWTPQEFWMHRAVGLDFMQMFKRGLKRSESSFMDFEKGRDIWVTYSSRKGGQAYKLESDDTQAIASTADRAKFDALCTRILSGVKFKMNESPTDDELDEAAEKLEESAMNGGRRRRDDDDDDRGGRRRGRDDDFDEDDRGGSRRGGGRRDDRDLDNDDDRESRRSSRSESDSDDRGSGRSRRDESDDIGDREDRSRASDDDDRGERSRSRRDEDDDRDPPRSRRSDDVDDRGGRERSRRSDDRDQDRGRDRDDDSDGRGGSDPREADFHPLPPPASTRGASPPPARRGATPPPARTSAEPPPARSTGTAVQSSLDPDEHIDSEPRDPAPPAATLPPMDEGDSAAEPPPPVTPPKSAPGGNTGLSDRLRNSINRARAGDRQ